MIEANGDIYVGDWKDHSKTGYGIKYYANGNIEQGRFEKGNYMGK